MLPASGSADMIHATIERGMDVQVRLGLEAHEAGAYQRQVGYMRLLGELYAYRIVDSRTTFDTLYTLLSFGHETPESAAQLDPLSSYFRCEDHSSAHKGLEISCSST